MTHQLPEPATRSSESGMALVIAMFMTLVLSVMASSLMFVSRTETLSAASYKNMSQARYAAESGLHSAANYLLWTYAAPGMTGAAAGDDFINYVITGPEVTFGGNPVMLSSRVADSNYQSQTVIDAFAAATTGELEVNSGTAKYTATAKLLSMREFDDAFTGNPVTLQTWELTGRGTVGNNGAEVEVSAIIERQDSPAFKYAAFATGNGCDMLRFGGGAIVDSYDSRTYSGTGTPTLDAYGGNVGTNGNMTGLGNTTTVNGSLSSPRSGVGNCTNSNVTAFTTNGATVTEGLLELGQEVSYPTPPALNPLPPTGGVNVNGGCGAISAVFCSTTAGVVTIDPATSINTVTLAPTPGVVVLGDLRVQAGTDLHLKAGTYEVNSITLTGGSTLTVEGEVIIKVAGVSSTTPIDFSGGAIVNNSYDPSTLLIQYAGTNNIKLTGGTSSAALIYAPNATAALTGGQDFYGAIVTKQISDMGGASIHYDRKLQTEALTMGNPMMGSFSWVTF
jgi:hypothetical protein